MIPAMHDRLRDYFISAGLTDGFKFQKLIWTDSGVKTDKFMVFRPNGGSNLRNELGGEYYVMVDVIGAMNGIRQLMTPCRPLFSVFRQIRYPATASVISKTLAGFPRQS